MKAFHKVAAALATIPVAGVIALTGAGIASAATCPAGQHWNEMGGGSGFCSPDASGGGTGGNGSVDLGGTNTPAPQAPVLNQPAPYKPPVYGPAPVSPKPAPIQQAPIRQAPAPIPKAPVVQIPAPVQNYGPGPADQVSQDAPTAAVSDTPVGATSPEIVKSEASKTSESNTTEAKSNDDKATSSSTLVAVEPGTKRSSVTASPSASSSVTPSADPSLDASRTSENENSSKSMPGLLIGLGVVLISLLTWCIIKINQTRSASRR